jgi:hypothetical protein
LRKEIISGDDSHQASVSSIPEKPMRGFNSPSKSMFNFGQRNSVMNSTPFKEQASGRMSAKSLELGSEGGNSSALWKLEKN